MRHNTWTFAFAVVYANSQFEAREDILCFMFCRSKRGNDNTTWPTLQLRGRGGVLQRSGGTAAVLGLYTAVLCLLAFLSLHSQLPPRVMSFSRTHRDQPYTAKEVPRVLLNALKYFQKFNKKKSWAELKIVIIGVWARWKRVTVVEWGVPQCIQMGIMGSGVQQHHGVITAHNNTIYLYQEVE